MALSVEVICRNLNDDRVIPRFARYLRDGLGWNIVPRGPSSNAVDLIYLSVYFEVQKLGSTTLPLAAYFSHREEDAGSAKAALYDKVAGRVQLRIATAKIYADGLETYGPTVQIAAPLERDRFTIARKRKHGLPVVGLSGYTYQNQRKGEDLITAMMESKIAARVEWRASGRGWPVTTKRYTWAQMPTFYHGLDVLVCPSRVEGIPMPPLEALACGVRVVVPRGVGMLDELPDVAGIYRYERGNAEALVAALEQAAYPQKPIEREALREATAPYSVAAWVQGHAQAIKEVFGERVQVRERKRKVYPAVKPVERATESERGIYCVAFGPLAREAAENLMHSAKAHMPDIPICLCAAEPIGVEDVFVQEEDSDIGGRRAKLRVYELAPAEWKTVLYLDADTEITAPVYQLFEWAEDGWDLVICKDIHPNDVLGHIKSKVYPEEAQETQRVVGTWDVLQLNGGVWAFARNPETAAFFAVWRVEWERWAQRDQGALLRALYTHPLHMLVLGNEWNTFPKFQPNQETAGIKHYPGDARRWTGVIRGRLDGKEAWAAVEKFETRRGLR